MTNTKKHHGISLGELKERIYKTLGEYSVNGEIISGESYEKADMENRMIGAINTSVTKALQYLPVFTYETEVYFPQMKYLAYRGNENLSNGKKLSLICKDCAGKTVLNLYASGNVCVKIISNENVIVQKQLCGTCFSKVDKHFVTFEASGVCNIELTPLETSAFVDSVYVVDMSAFGEDFDLSLLPEYNKTFARIDDNVQKITYAACNNKSIPVYEYDVENGYVYTSCNNEGKTIIHYLPEPKAFTNDSGEDEMLCLPEITICAIVYLAASELCSTQDADIYNRLAYNYRDIVLNCYDRQREYGRNCFYSNPSEKLNLRR